MFNNIVLDVFIGLILIYLLYSLLITLLGEMIAYQLGIRQKVLRLAIERMLNDGYYRSKKGRQIKDNQKWWKRYFLSEHPAFKSSLAGKFYEYPSIKYLSQTDPGKSVKEKRRPEYFSAENFADTLINMMQENGQGPDILTRVGFCLQFNTLQIQDATLKHINNLLSNSQNDPNIFKGYLMKWFNETMDRTNGWYKNRMRIISFTLGLLVAISFNVDSIRITRLLATDKTARAQMVDMAVAVAKDSAFYRRQSPGINDSATGAQSITDSTFKRLNEDINKANLILGLGWGFETLREETKEEINKTKQAAGYEIAKKYMLRHRQLRDTIASLSAAAKSKKMLVDSLQFELALGEADSIRLLSDNPADTALASRARNHNISLRMAVAMARLSLEAKENARKAAGKILSDINHDIDSASNSSLSHIDSLSYSKKGITLYGQKPYCTIQKVIHVIKGLTLPSRILGFLITALALSLGAPFWFDMLKKVIAIRGSGVKPEEKKQTSTPATTADNINNKIAGEPAEANTGATSVAPAKTAVPLRPAVAADDMAEAVLKRYETDIKSIPGVTAVFTLMPQGASEKHIQVNVTDERSRSEVIQQFGTDLAIGKTTIPLDIVITGKPKVHLATIPPPGSNGVLKNASGMNGFGSLGCVLQDSSANKLLLSCWHVMKGNLQYSQSDNSTGIQNSSSVLLGNRNTGWLQGNLDFALAAALPQVQQSLDNSFIKLALGINQMTVPNTLDTQQAVSNHASVSFYNIFTQSKTSASVLTDSSSVTIYYPDMTRQIQDVLIIYQMQNGSPAPVSAEGNSGSVIFDDNGCALGMIIGSDATYTYAIKLVNMFSLSFIQSQQLTIV